MKKKKATPKPKRPRLNFRQRLAEKLIEAKIGKVTEDCFNDNSSSWISLRVNNTTLEFSFDFKGEKLQSIELFQDVVEVTGQRKTWSSEKP